MKKYSLFTIALFWSSIFVAQTPDWIWSNGLNGTEEERCHSIEIDAAENVYIAGSFASSPYTIGTTSLINQGNQDVFLAKYDSLGNAIWALSMGGSNEDEAWDVKPDNQNNVYVTGYYRSSTFEIGSDTTLVNTGSGSMFIVKFDSSGNFLWAQNSSGSGREWGRALGIDEEDNVYLGGNFLDGDMTIADTTLLHQGSYDMFVTKYSSVGTRMWTRHTGGSGVELLRNLTVSPEYRNVYVIGDFTTSSISFDNTTFTNANPGERDNFVLKLNQNGILVWARHIYGTAEEFGSFVAVDWQENCYVTGQFNSSTVNIGSYQLSNTTTSKEVYLAMYDPNGNVMWATGMYGDGDDLVYSITSNMTDGVFISGWFNSTSFGVGSDIFSTNGGYDLFVSKFDNLGNYFWTKHTGGTGNDYAECVAADIYGNLYVAGRFDSPTLEFDNITLTNSGDYDAFIGKLKLNDSTFTIGSFNPENKIAPIYPNPTSDFIYLGQSKEVRVYSSTGRLVIHVTTERINLSELQSGLYIITIDGAKYKVVKR
ncbi:MAG: T9SS type A sorting domain-containing protein [Bacteroidales bacterium]|nr:T9SS type A sorting domain-containing protein [Bacteroidales bacterium]MCF8456875.1 T9SS type A sorting domain-containing protein [Bacteroidales bacterium]